MGPIQYDSCHNKKGKFGQRHKTRKKHREKTVTYNPRRNTGRRQSPTSQGERPGKILALPRTNPTDPLIWDFQPLELWAKKFLLFKTPHLWYFFYSSPSKLIQAVCGGFLSIALWNDDLVLFRPVIRMGFPGGASGREPACQCRRYKKCGFDPWVGKVP